MRKFAMLAVGVSAAMIATPALADREPNQAERQQIERVLKNAGYVSWEEVELDDDGPRWEVDDARRADGTRWDIRLAPTTYAIISADRDD